MSNNKNSISNKKIKVAWICHFSNAEIRKQLPLAQKGIQIADFAPWITCLIQEFEKINDIELHIISPHRGLKSLIYKFHKKNIYYYFFKSDLPIIHKRWPSYFCVDEWTGFLKNRILIRLFINRIRPTIINLHGAENNYYSSSVLGIKNYPIYVSIQGIYNNPIRFNNIISPSKARINNEKKIYHQCKYFGIRAPIHINIIKKIAINSYYFMQFYPTYIPDIQINSQKKIYDFVYFARLIHTKGIEELLEAIALIKKEKKHVSLNIIGTGNQKYINLLKHKIEKLNIKENIRFAGRFSTVHEAHKEAIKAKISVLPTKVDTIPGTIIESILLGLPVVSCETGGIPFLNKDGEAILLSKPEDIENLAKNMKRLLFKPEISKMLNKKALAIVNKEFNNKKIAECFIKQYKAIISNYYNGKTITQYLLFNEKLFKKYQ